MHTPILSLDHSLVFSYNSDASTLAQIGDLRLNICLTSLCIEKGASRAVHLFIVSERTLPIHLTYEFAGVTKPSDCSWSNVTINPSAERAQASLYADVCRVHVGDEILFYLETPQHDIGREGGRFLGIFEVVSDFPFYEPGGAYLSTELGMPLIYRHLIRPKEIFRDGLTEWQMMDEMTDFRSVYDIPWTLIYRKMTAKRGCTPLLPHEAKGIRQMLDLRNSGQRIHAPHVAFDTERICLIPSDASSTYTSDTSHFDKIDDYLVHLINDTNRKWELHLQAYLMQEIGRNPALTEGLFPAVELTWIGNEIYAGAGMQSIDILVYSRNNLNTFIHLIELKSVMADSDAAAQLNRYIKWLKAHIPDVSIHQIIPTLIAPEFSDEFHQELQTYLHGHGITQYRVITIDGTLSFTQEICTGF
jgi:hypothetical protein